MERKQVWFTLPVEYSPDCGSQSSDSQASGDFKTLQASLDSDQESFGVPKTSQPDLSQYTLRPSMDNNTTNETYSTNDSQDISTSQQESNSEGQYGYDEGNSTGSLHDSPHSEAVSTAIMEVSGELILGKFTPQKPHSCGGSESSDISDDDHRRPGSGGAIAKYPESSTGLSDNDWNPYATESDTNQTPRSPRSNGSDDQSRGGYVSKATINIGGLDKIKSEPTTTVSMRTGQVTYGEGSLKKDTDDKPESTRERTRDNHGDKMDILRYVVDESKDNDMSKERNEKVERSQESRLSADSGADTLRRESSESGRSFDTAGTLVSDVLSGRPSSELDRGEVYVSDVRDSVDSARSDGLGPPSGRQSLESGRSESARQSVDTQKSGQSVRSRASDQSQKSVAASAGSDRSERLDRLSDAAGDNLKEIMQFESAQRGQSSDPEESKNKSEPTSSDEAKIVREPSPVSRTRLTARLEPYVSPKRSDRSPERSPKVAATSKERYMSVAERERLLSESPEFERLLPKSVQQERSERETFRRSGDNDIGTSRPAYSSTRLGDLSDNLVDRSPSQVSMQRVSSLFEETKRQAREAVAFQRPDPSGSEERFPLKERLTISKHDDSFKAQDKSGASDGRLEKSRESDTARSLNSEEVARVLARFSDERAVTNVSVKSAESDVDNAVMVSAFDRVNNESGASGGEYGRRSAGDASRTSTESEDEIARRVRSILAQTDHFTGQSKSQGATEYVPRTMDYSRLQRDLQEIQDNLPDAPPPRANDSIHLQRKLRVDPGAEGTEGSERSPREEYMKSLESTATTMGRESGVSEYGRRLVWDHGADLEYTDGYGGQFLGTRGSSDTLSTRLRASGETDTLTATTGRSRPDSAATVDTDGEDFQGTRTLTGSDIARAEKIVDQVMNRRAEGDLKESVEDIIARYRNERQDLFQRHQAPPEPLPPPQVRQTQSMPESSSRLPSKFLADTDSVPVPRKTAPVLTNPDVALSGMNASGDAGTAANGKRKEVGLAERVYRILQDEPELSDNPDEKGMAKKVYKILASERPHDQVNGILTDTMTEEHELLKKLVSKPKEDSSLDDSGLNVSSESFNLEDKDVRKQLDYSTFSSPGKGDKSDFARLREVTSAPYSALSNARSLLSNQLQKMSERNFDKSVELRTPFRQRIQCYPVYGAERQTGSPTSRGNAEDEVREAWMPVRRSAQSTTSITQANRDRALDNERFFLTERDRNLEPGDLEPQTRPRTYSDPFDSPSRYARGRHTRSKSEEAANQSDVSQHSFVDAALSPTDRRPAQSPRRLGIEHATPKEHRPKVKAVEWHKPEGTVNKSSRFSLNRQDWSCDYYTSLSDSSDKHRLSDSSDGKPWCYHGNQISEMTRDPENDIYIPDGQESEPELPNKDIRYQRTAGKPRKVQQRQSRSRLVKTKTPQRSGLDFEYRMSRSLPMNRSAPRELIPGVPISTEDMYELLNRSQAQEKRLAELQKKLLGPRVSMETYQNMTSSSSDQSFNRSEGHSSCHGNRSGPSMRNKLRLRKNFSREYYRGDGSPSPTESDTSSSRKGARFRPYRPAGSRDMYYTESGDETNESATTIESTHPGSDDAAPPYIPSQYLGSRRDEPQKHPTGIYGKKEKDALSTIDEQSVKKMLKEIFSRKDDREKALSASTGSGKDSRSGADDLVTRRPIDNDDDKRSSIRTVDTGYHSTRSGPVTDLDPRPAPSRTADPPELSQASRASGPGIRGSGSGSSLENELVQRRSTSPRARTDESSTETQYGVGASARGAASLGGVERPGFKTREQFQRDFERRERELKDILSQRSNKDSGINERDSLGASTRSDPGGMLTDDAGPRWEYRESDHPPREFLAMDPEPAYPQERLRHSRSRSDTDLAGLSPSESQRYSSPMQPGTRFLELSTQPSPIFNHHDSYTHVSRGAPQDRAPAELPRVPLEKEMPRGAPPAKELPRVPLDRELPRGVPQGQGKQPGELPRVDPEREYRQPHPAPELPKNTEKRPSSPAREFPVRALEPGDLGPVELGVDPRRIPSHMRNQGSRAYSNARSTSPVYPRQKEMEVELEKLNKQLSDQVNELQGGRKLDGPEEFVDQFPPSKKAQVLRQVLEQEYVDNLPPNINDMWARFKEQKEQSMSESSLDSQRLNALSGLLENPTHHTVNSFVQERTEEAERRKREDRERLERMKEEEKRVKDNERRLAAERAAVERTRRREELKQRRGLSEEESNGSYSEILMEEERKRERRLREAKKEEKRERRKSPSKKASPKSMARNQEQEEKGRRNGEMERRKEEKGKSKATETDIRARKMEKWHSDSMDTLFSIPEDASFEQSPTKAESDMKTRQRRHRHVIDPLMSKLRDKIKLQRVKIDKERRKELKRVDKLKKLEMLLTAKRKGQLSDKAIGVELEDVSSTSTCLSQAESSQNSDSMLTALSVTDSTLTSDHSTTMKDSSIENRIKLQVKKYPDDEFYKSPQKHYLETDSAESSDFNNILVERLKEKSETQKPKEKKSSKGKKYKVDEFGNKIRKERKDRKKKAVFDMEVSEDDLQNQLKRYEEYMTPDRGRRLRDASTMYPSPITVSPPSRRRMREVLMKSEAIQTSPSVRSTSPTYAYDEVPVASVPYMSSKKGGKSSRTSRRRPSPSPDRSTQSTSISPPRRTSRSPVTRATRKSSSSPVTRASKKSRSPVTKTTRKSSASPVNRPTSGSPARRRFSPPITRRQAKSPIWRPESEDRDLPYHGMFTPEYADENSAPKQQSKPAETWFISMSKSDKPWRQPLKERQANAIRKEAWQPTSISQSNWRNIVNSEPVRDKGGDPSDVSRDTKFDLDPEGQPLGEGSDSEESTIDLDKAKPLSKMTLQEAFQYRKNHVISRLRERQKRLNLAAEQRRMEAYLKMERDRLFQEEKRKEANPDAHPYSEHLYKPARRIISKEEMKELTQKKYKKLPEVLQQQKLKKRQEDYSLNRIKARLFNRKVQKKVLIQANKWGS